MFQNGNLIMMNRNNILKLEYKKKPYLVIFAGIRKILRCLYFVLYILGTYYVKYTNFQKVFAFIYVSSYLVLNDHMISSFSHQLQYVANRPDG